MEQTEQKKKKRKRRRSKTGFKVHNTKGMLNIRHFDKEKNILFVYADVSNSVIDGLEIGVDSVLCEIWCKYGMKYLDEGIPNYDKYGDRYFLGWQYDLNKIPKNMASSDVVDCDVRSIVNQLSEL